MSKKVRVIQYGCGHIGGSVARLAAQRQNMEIVGAIDIDKGKACKDLAEVIGLDRRLGVAVSNDAAAVLVRIKPDVVLHTTSSWLKKSMSRLSAS